MATFSEYGVRNKYAIHPVADACRAHNGCSRSQRPYDAVCELEDINIEFAQTDVAFVIGKTHQPGCQADKSSPIYGTPSRGKSRTSSSSKDPWRVVTRSRHQLSIGTHDDAVSPTRKRWRGAVKQTRALGERSSQCIWLKPPASPVGSIGRGRGFPIWVSWGHELGLQRTLYYHTPRRGAASRRPATRSPGNRKPRTWRTLPPWKCATDWDGVAAALIDAAKKSRPWRGRALLASTFA